MLYALEELLEMLEYLIYAVYIDEGFDLFHALHVELMCQLEIAVVPVKGSFAQTMKGTIIWKGGEKSSYRRNLKKAERRRQKELRREIEAIKQKASVEKGRALKIWLKNLWASVCAAGDGSAYQWSTVLGDDVVVVAKVREKVPTPRRLRTAHNDFNIISVRRHVWQSPENEDYNTEDYDEAQDYDEPQDYL
ncbi:hypothetical protein Tco_1145210 [Tanacetum coccineum]